MEESYPSSTVGSGKSVEGMSCCLRGHTTVEGTEERGADSRDGGLKVLDTYR